MVYTVLLKILGTHHATIDGLKWHLFHSMASGASIWLKRNPLAQKGNVCDKMPLIKQRTSIHVTFDWFQGQQGITTQVQSKRDGCMHVCNLQFIELMFNKKKPNAQNKENICLGLLICFMLSTINFGTCLLRYLIAIG